MRSGFNQRWIFTSFYVIRFLVGSSKFNQFRGNLYVHYKAIFDLNIIFQHGVGNYASTTTHVALIVAAMFLPTLVIRKLTAKWTIVVSMCGYMTFCAAQFHPTFGTLIPAAGIVHSYLLYVMRMLHKISISAIVGICASTLWSTKCFYLTQV